MIFVYYNDDYPDNGGLGLERFPTAEKAEAFIAERMKHSLRKVLSDYTVIGGEELTVRAAEVVKTVKIE